MTPSLALATAWTLLMLVAVAAPGGSLPSPGLPLPHLDKAVHFGLFAGYGWLWMAALHRRLPVRAGHVLASGLAYAALLELVQLLPFLDRTPDLYDALFNALGLGVAVGCYYLWQRRRP